MNALGERETRLLRRAGVGGGGGVA